MEATAANRPDARFGRDPAKETTTPPTVAAMTIADPAPLGLGALALVHCHFAVSQRGHVGRMAGHDPGFTLGAGDDDHVDVVGHHHPVGRDELEMQIGHQRLPSIA